MAQGFFQVFGIDYTDTYSLVAKFVSIRILLAISVQLGLIIHTMDVDTAFLNATLEEDIWVQIPTGTKLPEGDDGIYKLLMSLYGLKQASKCWNHLINNYVLSTAGSRPMHICQGNQNRNQWHYNYTISDSCIICG